MYEAEKVGPARAIQRRRRQGQRRQGGSSNAFLQDSRNPGLGWDRQVTSDRTRNGRHHALGYGRTGSNDKKAGVDQASGRRGGRLIFHRLTAEPGRRWQRRAGLAAPRLCEEESGRGGFSWKAASISRDPAPRADAQPGRRPGAQAKKTILGVAARAGRASTLRLGPEGQDATTDVKGTGLSNGTDLGAGFALGLTRRVRPFIAGLINSAPTGEVFMNSGSFRDGSNSGGDLGVTGLVRGSLVSILGDPSAGPRAIAIARGAGRQHADRARRLPGAAAKTRRSSHADHRVA